MFGTVQRGLVPVGTLSQAKMHTASKAARRRRVTTPDARVKYRFLPVPVDVNTIAAKKCQDGTLNRWLDTWSLP